MNIAIQCCSLLVLIVIMYLYLSCKKVFLNSEFAFLTCYVLPFFVYLWILYP